MVSIYILKLANKKYYIGKTNNISLRVDSHFNAMGAAWTKLHRPLEVLEIIQDCDSFDEDKYTLMYMSKFGIDNVRGGTFCETNIDEYRKMIEKMMLSAADRCFICGSNGHFMKECRGLRTSKESSPVESTFQSPDIIIQEYETAEPALTPNSKFIADVGMY